VKDPTTTSQWRRIRLLVLERDGGLCRVNLPGCTTQAEHVDHIVPWRLGGAVYDPANLRAACAWCNKALANKARSVNWSRDW
jgi:5-methylcytosine-specific restriction endonuclease McrA